MSSPIIGAKKVPAKIQAVLQETPAWTRLEPQSVDGDPTPGLEARIHDPLWLLGRQWQLGEFRGEDAGTPLAVHVETDSVKMTAWRPGAADSKRPGRPLAPGAVLDPIVQREALGEARLGLRQRAEAGAYLVELLGDAGFQVRDLLLQACPLDVTATSSAGTPPQRRAISPALALMALAAPDAAQAALQLEQAGGTGLPAWLANAGAAARATAKAWLEWYRQNVAPTDGAGAVPTADGARAEAWNDGRLEYGFSVRLGGSQGGAVLRAPAFEGGRIDWYAFDVDDTNGLAVPDEPSAEVLDSASFTLLATPLRFAGMPADRYWQFEEGAVNLCKLEVQPYDLARLCLAEFAFVYANDWLVVPVDAEAGALTRILSVTGTDSFGEPFEAHPVEDAGGFKMFELTGSKPGTAARGVLLPPSSPATQEGPALEEVLYLRDQAANMAWAVERRVQGRSGDPRDRGDEKRPAATPHVLEPGTELQWVLMNEVPYHWIPMVPVSTGVGSYVLMKGTMTEQDESLGVLLAPTPLLVQDEEIPRDGVRVRRVPMLARAADGSYLRWVGRRVSAGRGEGASGLGFDLALRP